MEKVDWVLAMLCMLAPAVCLVTSWEYRTINQCSSQLSQFCKMYVSLPR